MTKKTEPPKPICPHSWAPPKVDLSGPWKRGATFEVQEVRKSGNNMSKSSEAIAQAWAQAQTNNQAAEYLKQMMKDDDTLYREIMDPYMARAALNAVVRNKIAKRTYLWTRPSAPDARVTALSRTNAATLLDMRLPGGKRLGDANRTEVSEAREYYATSAGRMAAKASFFDAVASRMKPRQTVSQALSAVDLEKLKDAA